MQISVHLHRSSLGLVLCVQLALAAGCEVVTDDGAELDEASALASGLVAYWAFDEVTGTVASDGSGSGRTGSLENGATWAAGVIGGAIGLDGMNDDVSVAPFDVVSGRISVSTWLKRTGGTSDSRIISKARGP